MRILQRVPKSSHHGQRVPAFARRAKTKQWIRGRVASGIDGVVVSHRQGRNDAAAAAAAAVNICPGGDQVPELKLSQTQTDKQQPG